MIFCSGNGLISFNKDNRANVFGKKKSTIKLLGCRLFENTPKIVKVKSRSRSLPRPRM